jgi:hypothetical protein
MERIAPVLKTLPPGTHVAMIQEGEELHDGWHRIYRAAQLGVGELPAIAITAEDEALIRLESP